MHVRGLVCRECKSLYPAAMRNTCEACFGPLEVDYNWKWLSEVVTRAGVSGGPRSM